jgi:hypothetical protein
VKRCSHSDSASTRLWCETPSDRTLTQRLPEIRFTRSSLAPKQFCILICGLLAQPVANLCLAAEWSVEPSASIQGTYDDNILLTPFPHSSVWGIILSPEVKFSRKSETLETTGGLKLNFNRYSDEGLDTEDVFLTFLSSYRAERNILGLTIDATRDSTLLGELSETGVVQARRQRDQLVIHPSWSRLLTETTLIKADYSHRVANYEDTSGSGLIDYRDQTASATLQYSLSKRTVLNLATYYDRYETDPSNFEATTYGIQAGVNHQFSETLRGELTLGTYKIESTIASQALVCTGPVLLGICFGQLTRVPLAREESSSGYTLSANLEKRWETTLLSGRLSREINPSGVGSLVQVDTLSASWIHDFSPTLKASVGASAYRSRYIGDIVIDSDSQYYAFEPKLSWRMTEQWTLDAGYRHSRVEYETSEDATGNTVYLMLSYSWPKIAVSR